MYPNFWGRNITGENSLTEKEVAFIRSKGCRIAMLFEGEKETKTEQQGVLDAKKAVAAAALGCLSAIILNQKQKTAEFSAVFYMFKNQLALLLFRCLAKA